MDNPFPNIDYKRWFNMLASISAISFIICLSGLVGLYTPNDLEFIKTICLLSLGILLISIGEIACRKQVDDIETGHTEYRDLMTGETWAKTPEHTIYKGKKEIRALTLPGFIFYLLGICIIIWAILF